MKLADLGEFGLIDRFAKTLTRTVAPGTIGIGDDCAVLPQTSERSLLVTTDLLVEGVHFLRETTSALDLGHKALAVNLSDIAAMGGAPRSVFLSLALPPETDVAWLDDFFKGLRDLASAHDVAILGGDTTRSPGGVTINVTLLGDVAPPHLKLRSQAVAGDIICVTKTLGDSAAGFKLLQLRRPLTTASERELVARHSRPEPSVKEGQWLARQSAVHAMMDLSDGLHSDIARILVNSKCGAEININALPQSKALHACAAKYGWSARDLAVLGGEDYGLLLTVAREKFADIANEFARDVGSALTAIGEITKDDLVYFEDGKVCETKFEGFKHF